MQMSAEDQTKYPKLKYYVKNNIPEVINNATIVAAMQRIGQINIAKLRQALTWGARPTIKVTPLAGAFGQFSPGIGSNELRLDTGLVQRFEKGIDVKITPNGKRVYQTGVSLLHELIHWGDDQDGVDRPGEEGEEFEVYAYGGDVGDQPWVVP